MARAIAARLKRLETRKRPPVRVRGSVARFTPDGQLIGPMPKGRCIVVTDFGTDAEWSECLQAQQARLVESAQTEGTAQ